MSFRKTHLNRKKRRRSRKRKTVVKSYKLHLVRV